MDAGRAVATACRADLFASVPGCPDLFRKKSRCLPFPGAAHHRVVGRLIFPAVFLAGA